MEKLLRLNTSSRPEMIYYWQVMPLRKFIYQIWKINKNDNSGTFLGTAFPVEPEGGILTCRHVVDVNLSKGELLTILDMEVNEFLEINTEAIRYPNNPQLDLAFVPNVFMGKNEYLPFLNPEKILIGTDVYTYGYFIDNEIPQGIYFGGKIAGFGQHPSSDDTSLLLPFAVLEGMSGAPLLTYHNGPKVVGIATSNKQARILAYEMKNYESGGVAERETVNRIQEFGIAYHGSVIHKAFTELGVKKSVVSDTRIEIPYLED